MRRYFCRVPLGLLLCFWLAPNAAGADELSELAASVTSARSEVERLQSELQFAKEERRQRLRAISRQQMEVDLELQRETTRQAQLETLVAEAQKRVSSGETEDQALRPAFLKACDTLEEGVATGLPFKKKERLKQLRDLRAAVETGTKDVRKSYVRLWQFVEDELRLARENGLYRQVVTLESGEELVDVAKVGMLAMYYRTADGEVGHTRRSGGQWEFVAVTSDDGKEQILTLFDAFRKQIRSGHFQLPNALPEGGLQ